MDPKALKKYLKRSAIVGAVFWTVVYVLLAVNLLTIGLGLWPVVVIPLVAYAHLQHMTGILKTYQGFTKAQPKQFQNVTFNINSDLTAEQVADAASRAASNEVYYRLTQRT